MREANGTDTGTGLTRVQQHLYAVGHFGVSFMGYVIVQWLMKFYFPDSPTATNLVPPLLAPWIMVMGRVTDGLNDPLAGYLSDSVRTRWGRRKPFMVGGLPFVFCLFLALWYPPAASESAANFWFVSVLLVLFFVSFTAYVGPYVAMLPEIVGTTQERLKLSALQGMYNVGGLIAAGFVTGAALKGGMSYQGMAWLVAGISLVAFLLPLFGPRDDPARVAGQPRLPLIRSLGLTLRNRPFWIYVVPQLLFLLGLLIIVAALPYAADTLLRCPEGEAGTLTGIALLVGLLCVPPILRRADRHGSKAAFLFSMRWFAVSASLLVLLPLFGRMPAAGVWLARLLVTLPGLAIGGLFALPYAILAGVTDHDRQRTGLDRQGMFFCLQGMVTKIAYSGAPMVVAGLLVLFPQHKAAVLTLIGPLAGALAVAALAVFTRFPEEEVQRAVAAVRASVGSAAEPAATGTDEGGEPGTALGGRPGEGSGG